jgi:hypothetical protein
VEDAEGGEVGQAVGHPEAAGLAGLQGDGKAHGEEGKAVDEVDQNHISARANWRRSPGPRPAYSQQKVQ